ncbi:LysR family transcriptional regulator [Rhizobium sp. KVB221]|uniref:LysR family transcriptional regulator n=1 Tax=Rhizobium setariae TaxID=2801340 RepID=A0A936YVR5_9HYPH|nr:LysR substrate-binding domain-containing protein [Rhizobium setariae]MBL0373950.1 LysR family transcriptional regulator [Rhizobium setariae]
MPKDFKRLPSLNGLRAFEVVSRHLNFRSAAEELNVTQGAVAQQIRNLEAHLGIQLFLRLPRTLALSDAGLGYVANIRKAFELIADATEAVRPEPQHVTISVMPSFAAKWLIPRLPYFTNVHPQIELRIVASRRLANFQTDAIDMAVRLGRAPFGPGLTADLLCEQVIVAVGSPVLAEKMGRPLQPSDVQQIPLLHDDLALWPQYLGMILPGETPQPSKNIRINHTSLAIEAAIDGQGLALASLLFVAEDIAAGKLVRYFDTELRPGTNYYVVAPRKPRHAASVNVVREWLLSKSEPEHSDGLTEAD